MRKSIGVCFGVKYNPELLHKFSAFFCCCKKARAFAAPSARSPHPAGTQRAAVPGRTGGGAGRQTRPGSALHWKSMTISHGNAKYSFLKYGQTMSKMVE